MAPHDLRLKVGVVVMLTHNFRPEHGLCNGTRLVVREISDCRRCVVGEVVTGDGTPGALVRIPRIRMHSDEATYPFRWERVQFPLRVAFCMTVNKSQGQTLARVAVYLPEPCFAHGQAYVACSRVRHPDDLRFVLDVNDQGHYVTRNVVLRSVLTGP